MSSVERMRVCLCFAHAEIQTGLRCRLFCQNALALMTAFSRLIFFTRTSHLEASVESSLMIDTSPCFISRADYTQADMKQ